MRDAQLTAAAITQRVLGGRSLTDELTTEWRRQRTLTAAERGQIQDLAYGTLRHLGRIDATLDLLLDNPLQDARLRNLLRVALYQLAHTRAAPYAIVDHAVAASAGAGAARASGLVNAVLRNFLRRRATLDQAAQRTDPGKYSYPQWWISKMRAQYPRDFDAILDADKQRAPMTLRVNTRRISRQDYLALLQQHRLPAEILEQDAVVLQEPMPVELLPGFSEGLVSVQDAAAQYAARRLDVLPGQRVLDACAAPGGKTAHILEIADAEVLALDNAAPRLARVEQNLARLGLSAKVMCADAGAVEAWWDGQPFDRILADVPCSASGVVRRHPDIKWLRRESDIASFASRQQQLIDALWRVLAPGGKLLYSTCSVFQEENQRQIMRFLDRHADARRLQPAASDADHHSEGQILPDPLHDGFFYALLQKI